MKVICPKCQTALIIEDQDLTAASGMARCPDCATIFAAREPVLATRAAAEKGTGSRSNVAWIIGVVVAGASVALVCFTAIAIAYLNRQGRLAPDTGASVAASDTGRSPFTVSPPAVFDAAAPPSSPPAVSSGESPSASRGGGMPVTENAFQKRPGLSYGGSAPFSLADARNDPLPPTTMIFQPVMKRAEEVQFDLPRLALKSKVRPGATPRNDDATVSMSLDDIKKAVVYITVQTVSGGLSGSGFVIRVQDDTALVATNHHVIEPVWNKKILQHEEQVLLSVVFDSGTTSARAAPAEVLSADADADLAILRVRGVANLPKPIDPDDTPTLRETMPVLLCGFPFGEALATSKSHPAITVGNGRVSSIRVDDDGDLAVVQINGDLNPGNSGGPVVDEKGRLVGIAVAKIRGTSIGLAIPPAELTSLLTGRVGSPQFVAKVENNQLALMAITPVMDPLNNLRSVSMHYLQVDEKETPEFRQNGKGWDIMPNSQRSSFALRDDLAHSFARLTMRDRTRTYAQISYVRNDGQLVASRPVPFIVGKNAQELVSGDAIAMNELNRSPDRIAGRPAFVRGMVFAGAVGRGDQYYLQVTNDKGVKPGNLELRTTHEVATQMGELPHFEHPIPCILTCRLGDKNGDSADIWVTRVTILDRNNVVLRVAPATGPSGDMLVDVNRDPGNYVGQTVTGLGQLFPVVFGRAGTKELSVFNRRGAKITNLNFHTTNDIATQLTDEGYPREENIPVRITFRIEAEKERTSHRATILQIEVLDNKGNVDKTFR